MPMIPLIVLWGATAAADPAAETTPPTTAPTTTAQTTTAPTIAPTPAAPTVDEGAISDAVEEVLQFGRDAVRVAVVPVADADEGRRSVLELAIVRAILDRRREDVVTPALLRAKLRARGDAQLTGAEPSVLQPLSADHVLVPELLEQGGEAVLRLKLLHVESGEVLGEASAVLGAGIATSASAAALRLATDSLVEQIVFAVEGDGNELQAHRLAVSALKTEGAASEARLDRFVQAELLRALRRRGALVVEREQLAAVSEQLGLGQVLGEQSAPQLGKLLGAQSLVVGTVAEAGASFVVSLRVIATDTGGVRGVARASFPRENVVTVAAVETRTPAEAAARSLLAPGWGQAYNGEGEKALAFGLGAYGSLLATIGLGVGALASHANYNDVGFFEELPAEKRGSAAVEARTRTEALYLSTAVAGGVTGVVWGLGVFDAFANGAPSSSSGGNW